MKKEYEIIYSTSKKVVSNYFSDELDFFEIIWRIFKDLLSDWKNIKPEKWPIKKDFKPELIESFGAVGGELDLATPLIIGAIAASIYHLGTEGEELSLGRIKEITNMYVKNSFKGRNEKTDKICESIVSILEVDVHRLKKIIRKPEKKLKYDYVVYSHENTENPKRATKKEVTKLRLEVKRNPLKYDVFVDDEKSYNDAAYSKGQKVRYLRGASKRALCLILRNVGGYYTYNEVEKKVLAYNTNGYDKYCNRRNISSTFKRMRKKLYGVLDDFIIMDGHNKRLNIKDSLSNKKLKYCLIESIVTFQEL